MTTAARFTTTVQLWGNSLGLRIARPLGDMVRLHKGSRVSIEVVEEGLLVRPQAPARKRRKLPFTEEQLIAGLNAAKAHADEVPVLLSSETEP